MKRYNVLSRIFSIVGIVAGIAMCIHVWADYRALSADPMTNSAPPWVSLLVAIPYGMIILAALILAAAFGRKYKRTKE